MKVATHKDEVREWRRLLAPESTVGFIPTMGSLHGGHEALIRAARRDCERVVVSVFVNPTQFGPGEDFEQYPRDRESDVKLIRAAGGDLAWFGDKGDLYPSGFATEVAVPTLAAGLCGRKRPGHFGGVALIVLKLLNIVQPHRAFFGQKDYQQLMVIRRLVQDLDLGVEIMACPTHRESDGLARSSRNLRLGVEARRVAPSLFDGLSRAKESFDRGERRVSRLLLEAVRPILDQPSIALEYLELVQPETLVPLEGEVGDEGAVMAVAATLDGVRLIDNIAFESCPVERPKAVESASHE